MHRCERAAAECEPLHHTPRSAPSVPSSAITGAAHVYEADYRARIAPAWKETARALAEDGWIVRSSSLDAPARRGLPWLSHLTAAPPGRGMETFMRWLVRAFSGGD